MNGRRRRLLAEQEFENEASDVELFVRYEEKGETEVECTAKSTDITKQRCQVVGVPIYDKNLLSKIYFNADELVFP